MHELPQTKVPTLEHRLGRKRRGDILVRRLQGWYNEVQRWRSTTSPDGYTETLLGHVRNMNSMVDQVAASPVLSGNMNLPRLNLMLGVHDLGEVGTGDIDRAKKAYESDKTAKDNEETRYFLDVILPALPYVRPWVGKLMAQKPLSWIPTLEKRAHQNYRAYESMSDIAVVRKTHDKEALLAKVMDRMDAVTKGVEHFHVGKTGEAREDAVLRQLAGANRSSALHLYRLFEIFGQKGNIHAVQDLATFMLDNKELWDTYDSRIFNTPRPEGMEYASQLPSFAEVLGEISQRYLVSFANSKGAEFVLSQQIPKETIATYLHTATKTPQRL